MSDGQDGSGQGIYAKAYDATGVAVGGEFLVNQTTAGVQEFVRNAGGNPVAVLASGDIAVVWDGAPQIGGNEVYARLSSVGVEDHPVPLPVTAVFINFERNVEDLFELVDGLLREQPDKSCEGGRSVGIDLLGAGRARK